MSADLKNLKELTRSLGGKSSEIATLAEGSEGWEKRALFAAHEAVSGAIGILTEVREARELRKAVEGK